MMQMRHWWWLIAMNVIDFLGLRLVLDGSLHEDLGCWAHIIFTLTRQLEWPTLISTTMRGKFSLVTLCAPIIIDILFFFQVLVRMEQEQHVAEDARRFAEQEAEAHRLVAEEAQVTLHILVASHLLFL
jgi:hypothetical protein